ncbi:hypothetical protein RUND412_007890 [Rhizina undulata]
MEGFLNQTPGEESSSCRLVANNEVISQPRSIERIRDYSPHAGTTPSEQVTEALATSSGSNSTLAGQSVATTHRYSLRARATNVRHYACPFAKHSGYRNHICAGTARNPKIFLAKGVHRVKEHVRTVHTRHYKCRNRACSFRTGRKNALHKHQASTGRSCPSRRQFDPIDRATAAKGKAVDDLGPGNTTWEALYMTLFPGVAPHDVPSPWYEGEVSPQSIYSSGTTVGARSIASAGHVLAGDLAALHLSVDNVRSQIEAPSRNANSISQPPNDIDFAMHGLGVEDGSEYIPESINQSTGIFETSTELEVTFENGDVRNTAITLPFPLETLNMPGYENFRHPPAAQALWYEPAVQQTFEYPDWTHDVQIPDEIPWEILDADFGEGSNFHQRYQYNHRHAFSLENIDPMLRYL